MRHWLITVGLLMSGAAWANPAENRPSYLPHSFQSSYIVYRSGSQVGQGERTFYNSSDGRFYFSSESKLSWFILSDYRKEQSWVRLQQGTVQPLEYQFDRTGTGPDRFSHIIYNHEKQSLQELKESYPLKAQWSEELLDPLSYQLQLRIDVASGKKELSYDLVYKGKPRKYQFEIVGEEKLKLPIGVIDTIKLKRVRESSSRETFIWLSKEHDYVLARIWQAKDGKEQADLKLASYKLLESTKTSE